MVLPFEVTTWHALAVEAFRRCRRCQGQHFDDTQVFERPVLGDDLLY